MIFHQLNKQTERDKELGLQLQIMEKVLFEVEEKMSNQEIAEYLKNIAEKLEKGQEIKLESGDQSVQLDTDRPAEFEIKVEEENGEESLELEIEWKKGSQKSDDLSIS